MTTNDDVDARAIPIFDGDHAVPMLEGFAMLGVASKTTALTTMRTEPGYPQVFYVNGRGFLLQSEILAYLARLAAQRNGVVAHHVLNDGQIAPRAAQRIAKARKRLNDILAGMGVNPYLAGAIRECAEELANERVRETTINMLPALAFLTKPDAAAGEKL